ncbi:GNAT family N-acetyltransferase [Tamlana sp. 2_MG-2023]|uniref:GNAT family N-acetyltransferase n=1 Tax=unclassified Tamlana TaxID=2614803 RepID=UPI0026E3902A|nr:MULTISPECIES: GNAT family N-acetyltransferase [unclassified Tamlana]MDO6760317.1 GNAT family N-acetyltransferase [Tamlana sp. 2_MG-2023]MDO6789985.1 GNAT family N-acetyltransferase [Tamlana sp. 1_MG-2023]
MAFIFKIIGKEYINDILPLVKKLNADKISEALLKERITEMFTQNYECAGVFDDEKLIGVCGLWFCTRHYSGRSVEPDHVFIAEAYRGNRLGHQFFSWIYDYVSKKGYESIELNTYVNNSASHKFYYNQGFTILGYHFFKKL